MMSCLITSLRARGGRDPVSSSCSLSSRRQCCPADRKCTEKLRLGVQPWESGDVCECVFMSERKRGSRKDCGDVLFFLDGTKKKRISGQSGSRAHEEDGPTNRTELPAGRAHEFTQAMFVFLCFFCPSVLTANNIYQRPHRGGSCL